VWEKRKSQVLSQEGKNEGGKWRLVKKVLISHHTNLVITFTNNGEYRYYLIASTFPCFGLVVLVALLQHT
jgi:hypothetical protein